jgi:hypothetical protein
MDIITALIEADGSVTFLNSPEMRGLHLGPSKIRRYSHVEPASPVLRLIFHALRLLGDTGAVSDWTRDWPCCWRARIINGPILAGRWYNRQSAIRAEIEFFNQNGVTR